MNNNFIEKYFEPWFLITNEIFVAENGVLPKVLLYLDNWILVHGKYTKLLL